jgi:hypothetical protein
MRWRDRRLSKVTAFRRSGRCRCAGPDSPAIASDGIGIETAGGVLIRSLLLLDVVCQIGRIDCRLDDARRVGESGSAIAGEPGAVLVAVPDDVRRRAGNGEVA